MHIFDRAFFGEIKTCIFVCVCADIRFECGDCRSYDQISMMQSLNKYRIRPIKVDTNYE